MPDGYFGLDPFDPNYANNVISILAASGKLGGGGGGFLGGDLGQIGANLATGGLYGVGQAAVGAAEGKPLLGQVGAAFNQLGPYGGAVYPVSPAAATAGNIAGSLAGGIGGGLSETATGPTGEQYYTG